MFIIWGKKTLNKDGGVVADWCNICQIATFFRLTDHYSVGHIYYIPLGGGTYTTSERLCMTCTARVGCDRNAYTRTLSNQEATGMTLDDMIQTTNPSLAENIKKQRDFHQQIATRITTAQQSAPSESGAPVVSVADTQMVAALNQLNKLDSRGQETSDFINQLRSWDHLTPSEREVLLYEINDHVKTTTSINICLHFLRSLPTPSPGWLSYGGCLGFTVLTLWSIGMIPALKSVLWGLLFLVGMIVVWIFFSNIAQEKYARLWVKQTLIPQAQGKQIDFNLLVGLLASIRSDTAGWEEKIQNMAAQVDAIADELQKKGLLDINQNETQEDVTNAPTPESLPPSS